MLNSEEDKQRHPDMKIRSLLQRAKDAGDGALRQQYLNDTQKEIAKLDQTRQGRLINQLQGEVLALQGRGGDTKVAHVTPGEIVIPERLQAPELLGALRAAAQAQGIDPARLVVGTRRNSINPMTGQPEFQDVSKQIGPWGPTAMPTDRLKEWIEPWIGEKSVFHPVTPEYASQLNPNQLNNYDRANGVARAMDNGIRAVGSIGFDKLPPPVNKFPIFQEAFESPFDDNRDVIDNELRSRRERGLLK